MSVRSPPFQRSNQSVVTYPNNSEYSSCILAVRSDRCDNIFSLLLNTTYSCFSFFYTKQKCFILWFQCLLYLESFPVTCQRKTKQKSHILVMSFTIESNGGKSILNYYLITFSFNKRSESFLYLVARFWKLDAILALRSHLERCHSNFEITWINVEISRQNLEQFVT